MDFRSRVRDLAAARCTSLAFRGISQGFFAGELRLWPFPRWKSKGKLKETSNATPQQQTCIWFNKFKMHSCAHLTFEASFDVIFHKRKGSQTGTEQFPQLQQTTTTQKRSCLGESSSISAPRATKPSAWSRNFSAHSSSCNDGLRRLGAVHVLLLRSYGKLQCHGAYHAHLSDSIQGRQDNPQVSLSQAPFAFTVLVMVI